MVTRVDSASLTKEDRPTSTGLRIFYEAGYGNVAGTYRSWKDGRDDDSIVSIGYSHLFYDVCRRHGYEALVVANDRDCESILDGPIEIRPLLKPSRSHRGGVNYYLGELLYGWQLALAAKARSAAAEGVGTISSWRRYHQPGYRGAVRNFPAHGPPSPERLGAERIPHHLGSGQEEQKVRTG